VLWRHCEEKHDNEIQEFRMNVTGMYNNDSMARQIAEIVRISIVPEVKLMNTTERGMELLPASQSCSGGQDE
jgi:hypothetical protein